MFFLLVLFLCFVRFISYFLPYSLLGETEVSFAEIAPDLQMVYFTGKKSTWDDLKVTKELGEGGFATVHLGEIDGIACAVKKLKVISLLHLRILSFPERFARFVPFLIPMAYSVRCNKDTRTSAALSLSSGVRSSSCLH